MDRHTLPYSSYFIQLEPLAVKYKVNIRLKCGEKAEYRGTLKLVEQHGGEFPGISFCLTDPKYILQKPAIQKCQFSISLIKDGIETLARL